MLQDRRGWPAHVLTPLCSRGIPLSGGAVRRQTPESGHGASCRPSHRTQESAPTLLNCVRKAVMVRSAPQAAVRSRPHCGKCQLVPFGGSASQGGAPSCLATHDGAHDSFYGTLLTSGSRRLSTCTAASWPSTCSFVFLLFFYSDFHSFFIFMYLFIFNPVLPSSLV